VATPTRTASSQSPMLRTTKCPAVPVPGEVVLLGLAAAQRVAAVLELLLEELAHAGQGAGRPRVDERELAGLTLLDEGRPVGNRELVGESLGPVDGLRGVGAVRERRRAAAAAGDEQGGGRRRDRRPHKPHPHRGLTFQELRAQLQKTSCRWRARPGLLPCPSR